MRMNDKIEQIKGLLAKPSEATDLITGKLKSLPVPVIVALAAILAFFV